MAAPRIAPRLGPARSESGGSTSGASALGGAGGLGADASARTGPSPVVLWGLFVTLVWVGSTAALASWVGFDARGLAMLLIGVLVCVPVGLIWTMVAAIGLARRAHADRQYLNQTLEALRDAATQAQEPETLQLLRVRQVAMVEMMERMDATLTDLAARPVPEIEYPQTAPDMPDSPPVSLGGAVAQTPVRGAVMRGAGQSDDPPFVDRGPDQGADQAPNTGPNTGLDTDLDTSPDGGAGKAVMSGPELAPDQDLEIPDLIRALNFPLTADDEAGFAALRLALRHRGTSHLIHAAQDVLTLLSQQGLYMDDLAPDMEPGGDSEHETKDALPAFADPAIWRRFAHGARGPAVAALGGIHDAEALSATQTRMQDDEIFRDAAHHFLRVFDKNVTELEPRADDDALVALSDTRTARAFMLLGRASGIFD